VLTTLLPSFADYLEMSDPQPSGTPRPCPGLYRDCFAFLLLILLLLQMLVFIVCFSVFYIEQNIVEEIYHNRSSGRHV
jgi:hypothetical protein